MRDVKAYGHNTGWTIVSKILATRGKSDFLKICEFDSYFDQGVVLLTRHTFEALECVVIEHPVLASIRLFCVRARVNDREIVTGSENQSKIAES